MPDESTRRRFLAAGATGLLGLAAGCSTTLPVRIREGEPAPETPRSSANSGASRATGGSTPQGSSGGDFSASVRERARKTGAETQRSVVKIRRGNRGGTGWVVDEGYVVTNSHVVRGGDTFEVETYDGRTATATRVGYHRDLRPDVALLRADLPDVPALSLGSVDALDPDQPVVTVGHPARLGEWVISLGRFAGYRESIDWVLSTVPADDGNSGGPLVTLDGAVVACVSGTTRRVSNRLDRPEKVFTSFPRPDDLTAGASVGTVERWVREWRSE